MEVFLCAAGGCLKGSRRKSAIKKYQTDVLNTFYYVRRACRWVGHEASSLTCKSGFKALNADHCIFRYLTSYTITENPAKE